MEHDDDVLFVTIESEGAASDADKSRARSSGGGRSPGRAPWQPPSSPSPPSLPPSPPPPTIGGGRYGVYSLFPPAPPAAHRAPAAAPTVSASHAYHKVSESLFSTAGGNFSVGALSTNQHTSTPPQVQVQAGYSPLQLELYQPHATILLDQQHHSSYQATKKSEEIKHTSTPPQVQVQAGYSPLQLEFYQPHASILVDQQQHTSYQASKKSEEVKHCCEERWDGMQGVTIKTEKKSCSIIGKKVEGMMSMQNGGCSRTNPWAGQLQVTVKREAPEGGMIPIKTEQSSPSTKTVDISHQPITTTIAASINNGSIPVGIAVARQRLPHELGMGAASAAGGGGGGGGGLLPPSLPAPSKDHLTRFTDMDVVGGGLAVVGVSGEDPPPSWPLPQQQAPPAPPSAWQYPPSAGVSVDGCMGVVGGGVQVLRGEGGGVGGLQLHAGPGLQLVRDPTSGALLLLPPAAYLHQHPAAATQPPPPPTVTAQPAHPTQTQHHALHQIQHHHMHDVWQEQFQQAVVWGGYGGVGTGVLLPPLPPPLAPLQLLGAELLTASTTLHHHTTHQTHHSTRLVALAAEPKPRPRPPPPPPQPEQGFLLYQVDCRERPDSPDSSPPPQPPQPDVQDASNQTDTPTPSEEEELNSNHAAECASEDIKHIIIPRVQQQVENIRITTGDNSIQITPMLYVDSAVQTKREPKTPSSDCINTISIPDVSDGNIVLEVSVPTEPLTDVPSAPPLPLNVNVVDHTRDKSVESESLPSVIPQESQPNPNINDTPVTNDTISTEPESVLEEPIQKPYSDDVSKFPQIKVTHTETTQEVKQHVQVDLSGLELLSNSIEQFETRSKIVEPSPVKTSLLHMPSLTDHVSPTSALSVDVRKSLQPPPLILIKTSPKSPKPIPDTETSHFNFPPSTPFKSNICDESNSLGGLGLLCALAEQRFMEEEEERKSEHGSVSTLSLHEENTQESISFPNIKVEKFDKGYSDYNKNKTESDKHKSNKYQKALPDQRRSLEYDLKNEYTIAKKNFNKEDLERYSSLEKKYKECLSSIRSSEERKSFDKQRKDNNEFHSVDKRRLSEKSRTTSSSTVDNTDFLESLDKSYLKFAKCDCKEGETHTCKERANWLHSMNAMELDMIMRLADLQRQYKEKQRELNKLTPKKSQEDPFKRGPGRPRKKSTASDRAVSPTTTGKSDLLTYRMKSPSGNFASSLNGDSVKSLKRTSSLAKLSEDDSSHLNDLRRENHLRSISPIADSNSSQSSVATFSSSKKRKVGRPKKVLSTGSQIATETIVAKKPKSKSSLVGYLLAAKSRLNLPTSKGGIIYSKTNPPRPCEDSSSHKKIASKNYKGLKLKTNLKPLDSTCYSSPASSVSEYKYITGYDVKQKYASLLSNDNTAGSKMRPKLKAEPKLKAYSEEDDVNNDWCASQSNLTDVKSQSSSMESLQDVHLKNKQKTDQLALKHKKIVAPKVAPLKKKRDLKDSYESSDSEHETAPKRRKSLKNVDTKVSSVENPNTVVRNDERHAKQSKPIEDEHYDASDSDNEDVPKETKCIKPEELLPGVVELTDILHKKVDRGRCTLDLDNLGSGDVRVLTAMGGLFYAGSLRAVRAPDVYAVTLDGERGNRPHILSREEALRDTILEVLPSCTTELVPGTRLCAYWSQQYRCLYPGTVAEPSTPDPLTDHKFVSVEFDDGDSGRIALEDIRLLQPDYPIVEYDLNPLLTLSKRRRQTSVNSTDDKKVNTSVSSTTSQEHNNSSSQPLKLSGLETFVSTSEQSQLEAEFSHRERKRLKKHKKEKIKRLLSKSGDETTNVDDFIRKKKKKHKCCDDHCKHRKHHKKHHRKHKRHHHSSSKEHSGSSSEDPSRSAMLATAFDQSSFFEIKDVSVSISNTLNPAIIANYKSGTQSQTSNDETDSNVKVRCKTMNKKKPLKVMKKTILNRSKPMNKGKKITVTDIVEQNGCLEFVTNAGVVESDKSGGSLVKKIKISSGKKDVAKDSGKGIDNDVDTHTEENDDICDNDSSFNTSNETDEKKIIKKVKKRSSSSASECGGSKMAAFLPAGAQLWGWRGPGHRRPQARGRARKCFYKSIQRDNEVINVGDSAVFLSTGRPDRPYIGQVESLWEGWQGGMAVRVRWYYHPEETIGCPGTLATPGGLFESPHTDENDVQTISHRCEVLSLAQYKRRLSSQPQKCDSNDTYYLAGHYDPTHQTLKMEPDIPFATLDKNI